MAMSHGHWKGFLFTALTTAVAILLVEPLVEQLIKAGSPATAAKLGIA
jgi:hypothetical protein